MNGSGMGSSAPQRQTLRCNSRTDQTGGGSKARVKVYRFGQHLQTSCPGTLVMCPHGSDADFDTVRAVLARAAYGDSVDYSELEHSNLQLFLLPDGEAIVSAGT